MGRYIARRILIAIPVFLLVTIIVFAFMRLSPGEPEVIALTREISPSQAEELRRELNLHRALPVQYGYWISNFVRGDLGKSDLHEFRVGSEIRNRLPNTLKLAALAILTEWPAYRKPDFERMRAALATPLVVDGRNLYDPAAMRAAGFEYVPVGRPVPGRG